MTTLENITIRAVMLFFASFAGYLAWHVVEFSVRTSDRFHELMMMALGVLLTIAAVVFGLLAVTRREDEP